MKFLIWFLIGFASVLINRYTGNSTLYCFVYGTAFLTCIIYLWEFGFANETHIGSNQGTAKRPHYLDY